MQSLVEGWTTQCLQLYKKLNEDYPETAEVCNEIKAKIVAFSKNLPLIICFTSDALLEEDWKEIQEVVSNNIQVFERDDIKVNMFPTHNLYEHIEAIQDITNRAEKKHMLAKKLKEQREEMR